MINWLKRLSVPGVIFGGLAGICLVATIWFGIEAALLFAGAQPITFYVRNDVSWHPGVFILVVALLGFVLGAAVTHFVFDGFKRAIAKRLN